MSKQKLITTKITPDALRMLRIIAAKTGEKQYEVLRRVLAKEEMGNGSIGMSI